MPTKWGSCTRSSLTRLLARLTTIESRSLLSPAVDGDCEPEVAERGVALLAEDARGGAHEDHALHLYVPRPEVVVVDECAIPKGNRVRGSAQIR